MVRRHYLLPSLNALAAFEAAARHQSLTRAAVELNVTPGAVSKQIKALETELGIMLFMRTHRAVHLTFDGERLYRVLAEGFSRVSDTLAGIRRDAAVRAVTIGTTNAFAQLWLMPRLGRFWIANQDILIDHVISDRMQDLRAAEADLRVRYGGGQWADEGAIKLFDDRIAAVASPLLANRSRISSVKDLAGLTLLSIEGIEWTWTNWSDWFAAQNHSARRLTMRRFNSYVIALQAAQDGQGVALGWMRLVKPLIAAGKLLQLTAADMAAPESFYVTWDLKRRLTPEASVLRDWLVSEAARNE
jgi:DNA-binding transcriptional LysR family regulator